MRVSGNRASCEPNTLDSLPSAGTLRGPNSHHRHFPILHLLSSWSGQCAPRTRVGDPDAEGDTGAIPGGGRHQGAVPQLVRCE